MNEALLGMLITGVVSLLTLIIPVINNWRKNRIEADRLAAELDKVDMETIVALKKQIKELVDENRNIHKEYKTEIAEINKRIRFLEDELRRYVNGYGRAMRYINKVKAPDETIPDFLLDTGELMKGKK